jgi:hypothetical protein
MQQNTRSMAVVLALSLLLFSNCAKSANSSASAAELRELVEFFPIDIGTSWTYKIEVGDVAPLEYRWTSWSFNGGRRGYRERRQLQGGDKGTTAYSLKLRITGDSGPQERGQAPIVRELTVENDSLRIFGGAKQVFWEIRPGALFPVVELRFIDSSDGPVGVPVKGTGYQEKRMLLFTTNHQQPFPVAVGQPTEKEKMIYYGIETNVPGYEGTESLHIQREIAAFEGGSEEVSGMRESRGWTEDMWFARDKGLVRLVQRIEGKTTMTWTLDNFSAR